MTTVRCYVPMTPDRLRTLLEERRVAGPLSATTVTASVRAADPAGEVEEWEHAALQAAAQDQLEAGLPVVVAAVDLTEDHVSADDGASPAVTVGDVDLPRVAALLLGDDVVTGDRTDRPSPGEEVELSWYDTTELAHVVELTSRIG
ncbi:DUF6912 family protein [Ornithinimicrobium tianjinense]|uniref:Uncharacterized protein n=1 Tax=Ornithinimicrobium tianjinense TaxID=1195761 RepID=A0A917F2W7_9MICO|nr:hypothetical protein [Ornithinimicrobium tianjinense]GGF43171.1 hypothetical protein GCM10011366_08790 [Ornithinimicrobium tianjinense]